jgi:hypothetical protein
MQSNPYRSSTAHDFCAVCASLSLLGSLVLPDAKPWVTSRDFDRVQFRHGSVSISSRPFRSFPAPPRSPSATSCRAEARQSGRPKVFVPIGTRPRDASVQNTVKSNETEIFLVQRSGHSGGRRRHLLAHDRGVRPCGERDGACRNPGDCDRCADGARVRLPSRPWVCTGFQPSHGSRPCRRRTSGDPLHRGSKCPSG